MQQGDVWIAPSIIIGFYFYQAINSIDNKERIIKFLLASTLLLGLIYFQALTAKLMPIIVQLILLNFFGKTLFKRYSPSLVERFVRLEFADLPNGIAEYCRKLTIMWTSFFAFNIVVCILLALYAPTSWWAIFTGVGMFAGTAVLMIGEYICRPFLFPDLEIPDMKSSVKNIVVNGRKVWEEIYNCDASMKKR